MALRERHPAVPTLTNAEIAALLEELDRQWTKYRYAQNRVKSAREAVDDVICALYPHVPGSRISEITGLDRSRAAQIYHERHSE